MAINKKKARLLIPILFVLSIFISYQLTKENNNNKDNDQKKKITLEQKQATLNQVRITVKPMSFKHKEIKIKLKLESTTNTDQLALAIEDSLLLQDNLNNIYDIKDKTEVIKSLYQKNYTLFFYTDIPEQEQRSIHTYTLSYFSDEVITFSWTKRATN
eukprot:COSAG01_NODE_69_length_28801_cov_10.460038_15_plen_158_part_00